jgi:hypothetical protein
MSEHEISTQRDRQAVADEILSLPDGKWTIKIYPWAQSKTTKQNRLLWKWNTEIANHLGWTKEDVHEFLKEKFLLNILYEVDTGFARMADSIRKVKEYSRDDYNFIRSQVIAMVSTTRCKAPWMAHYLTAIKIFCFHEGIPITLPPDKEMKALCEIPEEQTGKAERGKAKSSA